MIQINTKKEMMKRIEMIFDFSYLFTVLMAGALKNGGSLSFLWIAILISFACYMPVVLFSGRNPKVGMLMLPKSCAYAAIVLMGFSLI